MKRLNFSGLFVIMLLLAVRASLVHAGCPDPDRPAHKVTDMVESLNYYAEGSLICVVTVNPEWCGSTCRPGYRHRCEKDGLWNPIETCTPIEKKDARLRSTKNATSSSNAGGALSAMQEQADQLQTEARAQKRQDGSSEQREHSSSKSPGSCERNNARVVNAARSKLVREAPVTDYLNVLATGGRSAASLAPLGDAQAEEFLRYKPTVCARAGGSSEECLGLEDTIELNRHFSRSMRCLSGQGY